MGEKQSTKYIVQRTTSKLVEKSISWVIIVSILMMMVPANIKVSHAATGSELVLGKYIYFGNYDVDRDGIKEEDEKILWRVIEDDNTNNRVLLITDKIITLKAFDVSGESDGVAYTKGTREWTQSTIRDWLNSDKTAGNIIWTRAKEDNPYDGLNNYIKNENGFLHTLNFSDGKKALILNVTGDKITLLQKDELSKLTDAGYSTWAATTTEKARTISEYDMTSYTGNWYYWTRTIRERTDIYHVCDVYDDGNVYGHPTESGHVGVRPALWLDTTNLSLKEVNVSAGVTAYELTDNQPPVITVNGTEINALKGSPYTVTDAKVNVTAIDDMDGDITSNITVDISAVNTNVVGSYLVKYTVSDDAGNEAILKTRTVNVIAEAIPLITLNGDTVVNIQKGDAYTDAKATAIDSTGVDMGEIIGVGAVDTNTEGSYQIKYNITDSHGKVAAEVIRTVNVMGKYQLLGYAPGQVPNNRKNFKYYIGKDNRNVIKCMLVSKLGTDINFDKKDIIGNDNKFLAGIYYIDKDGVIKQYN